MTPNTFERYCKIARYCIIYHVEWDIACEATRDQLRWCKNRITSFKGRGTLEEKMSRAWGERVKLDKAEAEEAKQKEAAWLAENGTKDEEPIKTNGLINIPLPKDEQDEDSYWTEYLAAQVAHIQKHMDKLNGGSEVKTVVLHFFSEALPIVKKVKKVKKAEAA